ncbi:laminin subunit alpha-2-like isoform X2 [Ostrea edulis]|uniref:laminin subunit alpha-2-like isoform X2 n=1 Tax=Ostrea edulis TaxID=37623 RepID=UPI0024AF03B8|nr:laminin subunit alpha-2-like isoform X2 [Ostrea edulis]
MGRFICGILTTKMIIVTCFLFVSWMLILPVIKCQDDVGLFPNILNLATRSTISVNATCGEEKSEVFCKLVDHVKIFPYRNSHCDICDARSQDERRRHPITNAINGRNSWWQSPTLTNGALHNYVTITLDLKQVYQVAYVIVKAANSPRPGNWILERSIDGITYQPWQYFGIRNRDCKKKYGIKASRRIPTYLRDDEVICTTKYSKIYPLENGEIFISLINGRPGVKKPSPTLLEFTSARYVRLRLQRIRTLNADLMTFRSTSDLKFIDPFVTRRYFYSIKDISIGGQCICYGHASSCKPRPNTDRLYCECKHNTCGNNCEKCCEFYYQKPWQPGNNGLKCEKCNCHGHSMECVYNATVDAMSLSLNSAGEYDGGGVCIDCKDYTAGINCEQCIDGYYRPLGETPYSRFPCRPCRCDVTLGSTGKCVLDDSMMSEGKRPGDCICKETYGGPTCQECAFGYYGYPYCKPCPCNGAGTVNSQQCSGNCVCKANVEGFKCDRCKRGFFNLHKNNPVGCMPCFCFGVSSVCQSANLGLIKIPGGVGDMSDGMSGWSVTSVSINGFTYFIQKNLEGWLVYRAYPANQNSLNPTENVVVYYWQAPLKYLRNRLTSYGGNLRYTVKYETDRTVPYQRHIYGVDVIIQSGNMTIVNGKSYLRENVQEERTVTLNETSWFQLVKNDRYETLQPITKKKFMIFLFNIERLLIRATYHSAQNTVYLRDVTMDAVSALSNSSATLKTVEKCSCPRGYQGLSCEECESGYRRVGNKLYGGMCLPCNCNNHAERCDINTGKCNNCLHFTTGENCDQCLPGYYGDPRRGTEDDCKPCACPLLETTNQFSPTCQLIPRVGNYDNYRCDKCAVGYVGDRCERCDTGYYGDPTKVDGMCRPCSCGGNIDTGNPQSCDRVTGECLRCLNNTEGPNCQRCVEGYYGTAYNGDCKACNCDLNGSVNSSCDQYSGRCICKDRFYGRRCDQCQPGYGNVEELCVPCDCDPQGSRGSVCESFSGQCFCNVGVTGRRCDKCLPGYYGFSFRGCEDCRCNDHGTNQTDTCDDVTGVCNCLPNVTGSRCNTCKENFWGLATGNGCSPCECDRLGSVYLQCDQRTGQCTCKTGVDGQHCNQCRKGYYGFSISGCKRCQPCDKPGHVCDSITGQCVCPPLTTGPLCDKCQPNTWGYDSITGCKPCNCDLRTSESRQCDLITGQCTCKADYTGNRCEKCLPGFYNHPNCQLCLCSADGTDSSNCDNSTGICQCDNRGQCPCKVNVETRTCTRCRAGSFSLHKTNPYGCTECFCFERSSRCEQVPYIWKKVTIPDRSVSFDPRVTDKVSLKYKSYVIIPHNSTWAAIPKFLASKPIYWSLPDSYLGDLTLSYNGKMRLEVQYKSDSGSSARADSSPDIVVVGNNFQMTYRTVIPWSLSGERSIVVKFHPTGWKVVGFGDATRSFMMIVLQNVTDIYIKAAPDDSARFTMLTSVSLDSAQPGNGSTDNPALGVEICQCLEQYSGLSCQDPADGYYRLRHNLTADLSQPIRVIGHVVPCDCHRHSDICDRETGVCKNCQHNTTGVHCEKCRPGFYGDATRGSSGDCQPCICPTIENNFSSSCEIRRGQLICTNCTEGYIGIRCESCAEGYYGNPRQPSGKCQPCKCNPQGSVSTICNARGQCQCLPGITGDKCDGCQPRYAVEDGQCVSCDEGCTADLMSELDDLRNMTLQVNLTGKLPVPWNELWKIKNETDLLKDELETIRNAELGHLKNQTRDIEKEAQDLLTRSRRAKLKAGPLEEKAVTLKKNATDLEVDLNNTVKDMKEFVEKLVDIVQSLFHNKSGINVTDALEKVRAILKDIKDRDFSKNLQRTLDENKLSEKLSETILDMRNTLVNTSGVMEEIQAIMEKLMDLQKHSNESQSQSDEVLNMINNIVRKQNQTEDLLVDVDLVHDNTVKILGDGHQFNIESAGELNQAKDNIKDIERKASIFDQILPELRKKVNSRSQITEAEAKVRAAESHARGLSDYAEKLEREFEKTKADAADPLKAAQVYSNIVKAVNEAEEAAKRAIKAAEDSIQIAGVKNITDEVSRSLNRSRELLKQASKTLSKVPGLDKHLNTLNEDLLRVEKEQGIIKQGHADIKEALDQLPKDLGDRTVKVSNNVDKTADDLETLEETVGNVDSNIKNDLIPKFNRIQDVSFDGIFESIENSIDTAAKNVKKIGDIVEGVESAANRSMTAESRLNDKLKMLRDNIKQARAQAEKVKVSLSASGQCVRSYHSKSVPGVTNKISFSFKTNNTTTDQIILLLQRSPTEFLALEMINAKIQFSWNVGAGVGSVTSDLPIQNEANFIRTIDKWYHVKADRLGRIGTLLVSKLSDLNETKKVTGVSPVGRSFLKLDENSELYVSGVPFGINRSKELHLFQRSKELSSSANFSGCMNEMYIDDKKIGLHNFKTSTEQGCWGCRNVPTATAEQTGTFHFDGFGYSAKPQIRSYRSTEFYIKMEFKTFWRDAILLFTGNNKTGDFLSLALENKRVVLKFYLGGVSFARLESNKTYANNSWVRIQAERDGLQAYLQVDGTDMKYLTAPGSNTGLEMKGRPLYFGGIPESYDLQPFLKWGNINRTGFLGCLRQVQLQTFAQDLLTGETVGVTNGCPDEGYRTIGFYGNGFAKYTAASMLLDTADVSLSFRTTQKDALLLLAYDNDQRNFYSIVLSNGKVEGRFSTNSLPKKITTSKLFNDGQLHNVAIQKVGNRITVYVDDEEQLEEVTLQRKEVSVDHLYIGGVINLNFPQGQAMAANTQGLEGCVSDVIINQKILNLNTPLQFERADIGRCRLPTNGVPVGLEDAQTSKKKTTTTTTTSTTPTTTKVPTSAATTSIAPNSCAQTPDLQQNIFSLIFGNSEKSHGKIVIDPAEVQESFEISFDFRTFYDDGAVFLLTNKNNTKYVAAQIRDGSVSVYWTNNGGKAKKFISSKVVTNGQWHTAIISKDRRRISLVVDGKLEMDKRKITKKLSVISPLIVGSIMDISISNNDMVKHSLRGCMKNFKVNAKSIMIADATEVQGVTTCYINMEPGVFMDKNSYGVIASNYAVGREMKIELEFRTHKPNGVILSIADNQAVTLELHQGKLKFSVFNVALFTAESKSSESICNDQWHSLEATLIGNVVKLVLDGGPPQYGSSQDTARNVTTSSALFVGGVPDYAVKQIASFNQKDGTAEGFEGCLRNFKIDSTPVDWFSLVEQENVQRTGCPY